GAGDLLGRDHVSQPVRGQLRRGNGLRPHGQWRRWRSPALTAPERVSFQDTWLRSGRRAVAAQPGNWKETPVQITVETVVNAPVLIVWKAWNDPEEIKQWNAASDDWHTTRS